ncbi:MAG TPA: hypothetical protein VM597_35415, partial [Gemmataceae bacterium]|nr:hypothetical protein [Gemmataceae bacterium]
MSRTTRAAHLAPASRPTRSTRKARLRLDDLEVRAMQGSIVNGLVAAAVGATMGEPLEVMAAITGDLALLADRKVPAADVVGGSPPSEPERSSANRVEPADLEDSPAEEPVESGSSEADEVSFDVVAGVSLLDDANLETLLTVGDLGNPDPIRATWPAPDAGGGGTGGTRGPTRPDTANRPADVGPGPRPTAEPDQSIADGSAPVVAEGAAFAPVADHPVTETDPARPPEVFVTPPSRHPAATGAPARPPRVWVEAVQTATGHGFRVWRDGSSGSLSVRYRLTESSSSAPTVDRVEITDGNRNAAVVVPGSARATLTVLADPGYTVAATTSASVDQMTAGISAVTVRAESPTVLAGSGDVAIVTFTRTTAVGDLTVNYTVGGTAVPGVDYQPLPGTAVIPDGETRATVGVRPAAGAPLRGRQTVRISVAAGNGYDAAPGGGAEVAIQDPTSGEPIAPPPGIAGGPAAGGWSSDPVRYWDGKVWYQATDLAAFGFGGPWGVRRSWSNLPWYANDAYIGSGWIDVNAPRLLAFGSSIELVQNGAQASQFDLVSGAYVPQYFTADHLAYDSSAGQFVLTDGGGNTWRFSDPSDTALPAARRGQLVSYTDAYGTLTQVVGWRTDGKPTDVQRAYTAGGVTTTESFLYAYVSG